VVALVVFVYKTPFSAFWLRGGFAVLLGCLIAVHSVRVLASEPFVTAVFLSANFNREEKSAAPLRCRGQHSSESQRRLTGV